MPFVPPEVGMAGQPATSAAGGFDAESAQKASTERPFVHARHGAVIAVQHTRGWSGTAAVAGGNVAPAAIAELQRAAHAPGSASLKQRVKQAPQGGLEMPKFSMSASLPSLLALETAASSDIVQPVPRTEMSRIEACRLRRRECLVLRGLPLNRIGSRGERATSEPS
jgi:hypothetical protein